MLTLIKKKAGVAIFIADKINFRARKTIRGKEGFYVMTKGSVHQEDIRILKCKCFITKGQNT